MADVTGMLERMARRVNITAIVAGGADELVARLPVDVQSLVRLGGGGGLKIVRSSAGTTYSVRRTMNGAVLASVTDIVERLDGLPLALGARELARHLGMKYVRAKRLRRRRKGRGRRR